MTFQFWFLFSYLLIGYSIPIKKCPNTNYAYVLIFIYIQNFIRENVPYLGSAMTVNCIVPVSRLCAHSGSVQMSCGAEALWISDGTISQCPQGALPHVNATSLNGMFVFAANRGQRWPGTIYLCLPFIYGACNQCWLISAQLPYRIEGRAFGHRMLGISGAKADAYMRE